MNSASRQLRRGAALSAVACFLALAGAAPAEADDLAIHSPANGSVLNAPPGDITGDSHDEWFVAYSPSITGTISKIRHSDGAAAVIALFGRSFIDCACSDWNYNHADVFKTGPLPITDGQYRIRVRQNGTGLTSDDIQTADFTIDATAPDTTITSSPPAFDDDATPVFEFDGTDPDPADGIGVGSGIDHLECRIDGGPWSNCESGDEFDTPEGNRTFEVRAVDKAGNADLTPASHSWMVDTTDPTIAFNVTPKQRFLLHEGNGSATCTDPLSGGPPPVASGIASCGDNGFDNETLGPHKLSANAEDVAGNTASAEIAYVIDPPRYGDFVLDDDPVAYYRHNEAYPSSSSPQEIEMTDSSGNGHHGTYKNDVALGRTGAIACARRPHPPRACELAADPENRAAFFPERDGYGYANGIPSSPTGYSMEAWVKPRTSGPMMVMSHGRAGQLFIQANGLLAFEQSQDTVFASDIDSVVHPNEWSHVAATWNGSVTRLYVNGVEVGSSTTANKTPSGTSTFYVGYGEKAPWFHGEIDEAALYDHALSAHRIEDRHKIGTAKDNPSVEDGNSPLNTEGPFTDPVAPKNGGLYAPNKTPVANFACTDPDDGAPGELNDVASCTATVDGNPIANGAPLPDSIGSHTFVVTATDKGGNVYVHPHTYEVKDFSSLYGHDNPIAYYRLGDGQFEPMKDSSPNARHGEYKNDQDQGPVGIAGDGDTARDFKGPNGYGYANGLPAPVYQTTLEAWVHPDDLNRDQSIAGHGDGGELYLEGGVFKFRHGPQNRIASSDGTHAPNPNSAFTQVVGTWDGVDLRLYVNGQLEGTTESNRRPSSNSTFYVGYGEIKQWFDGRIDEVAYYRTALTPNRVLQHFLADPAADGSAVPGSTGTHGSDPSGTEPSGAQGSDPSGTEPSEPAALADADDDSNPELEKCVKRALKIANKKKRRKAVKSCRRHFATG